MIDPVHFHEQGSEPNHAHHRDQPSGWYFWDESWCDRYGPYDREDAARTSLAEYCRTILDTNN